MHQVLHDGVELLGDVGRQIRLEEVDAQVLCGISHHEQLLKEGGGGAHVRVTELTTFFIGGESSLALSLILKWIEM